MRQLADVARGPRRSAVSPLQLVLPVVPGKGDGDATGLSLDEELARYQGPLSRDEALLCIVARRQAEQRHGGAVARTPAPLGARLTAPGPREAREAQAREEGGHPHRARSPLTLEEAREEKKRKGRARRQQRARELEASPKRIAADPKEVLRLWEMVQPKSYVTPDDLRHVRGLCEGKMAERDLKELRRWLRARSGEWLSEAACAVWAVHWALRDCGSPDDVASGHPSAGFQVPVREWAEEILGVPRRTLQRAHARLCELGLLTRYGHQLDVSTITGGKFDAVWVSFGPRTGRFPVENVTVYSTSYLTPAGARLGHGVKDAELPHFMRYVQGLLADVRTAVHARFRGGAPLVPQSQEQRTAAASALTLELNLGRPEAHGVAPRTNPGAVKKSGTPPGSAEFRSSLPSSTAETFQPNSMAVRPAAARVHSGRPAATPSQEAQHLPEALVQMALRRGWGSSVTALANFLDWCTQRQVWLDRTCFVRAHRRLEGCTCGPAARYDGLHYRADCRARYPVVQSYTRRGTTARKVSVRAPVLHASEAFESSWREQPELRGYLTRLFEPLRLEVLRRLQTERLEAQADFARRMADDSEHRAALAAGFAARCPEGWYDRDAAAAAATARREKDRAERLTQLEQRLQAATAAQYEALAAEWRMEDGAAAASARAAAEVEAIRDELDALDHESAAESAAAGDVRKGQ